MSGYNPGDIFVDVLTVSSARGTLNLASNFISASIFESVFVPGTVATINVLDTDNALNNLQIIGDETVEIEFRAPGGVSAHYIFALNSVTDITPSSESLRSKQYTLNCVSEEALHAKTNTVQKGYDALISAIVVDIHTTYLKSTKEIVTEPTKGQQKITIASETPFKAIDTVRRRAISSTNKSSSYVYFETRDPTNQIYKFVTLESLFRQSPVKTFIRTNTVGNDIHSPVDNNIISYRIDHQGSTTDRIAVGGKRTVAQFNFRTWKYDKNDKTPDPTSYATGGSTSYQTSAFVDKFISAAKIAPVLLIPVDTSDRPFTHITDQIADQQSFISTLMENQMTIKVTGDAILKAGDIVECHIPESISTTGPVQDDALLSGRFLVSRVHHQILTANNRPRYWTIVELLKGNME